MQIIKIRKGLDIPLDGKPQKTLELNKKTVSVAIKLESAAPPLLLFHILLATKLFSPNISSHNNFNCEHSLSSIDINITPESVNNRLAMSNHLCINDSHLLCL